MMGNRKYGRNTATGYILRGLIPYTKENLTLAFKPSKFFTELAKQSGKSEATLRNAYSNAHHQGLIQIGEQRQPRLTQAAQKILDRYHSLDVEPLKAGYMLILFDIPQNHDKQRRLFVYELRQLGFRQVQKSVWASEQDHRETIIGYIAELGIGRFVVVTVTQPVFGEHYFLRN